MMFPRFRSIAMLAMITFALVAVGSGRAQTVSCEDLRTSVCDTGGFTFELIDQQPAPPSNSGSSTWTYKICVNSSECPLPVQFRDLSHFNIVLPDAAGANGCISENHQITLTQTGGFGAAGLSCTGSTQDNFCGQSEVAKCDVTSGQLDDGECVQVELTIAGEEVGVGPGAISVLSKAATNCVESPILGPSCEICDDDDTLDPGDECLTRTIGFWGTHPHITSDYLPVTPCGEDLTVFQPGSCDSASEALCSTPGFELRSNPSYVVLVRQLAAAKLNLAATADLVSGRACGTFEYNGENIQEILARCDSAEICNANKRTISNSGCIEAVDAFNNSQDIGFDVTPEPFDRPGLANPRQCRGARFDRIVIGKDARKGNKGLDCSM
jgi:hypothetical protein